MFMVVGTDDSSGILAVGNGCYIDEGWACWLGMISLGDLQQWSWAMEVLDNKSRWIMRLLLGHS